MSDKNKKNIIYFAIGLILIFVIRYFDMGFFPAMLLAVGVSGLAGYIIPK